MQLKITAILVNYKIGKQIKVTEGIRRLRSDVEEGDPEV